MIGALISSGVFVVGVLSGYSPFSAFRPTAVTLPLSTEPACMSLGVAGNAEWEKFSADQFSLATAATRELGAGRVRIGANWAEVEPAQGRFEWAALDSRVRSAREAGLTPLLVLQTLPSWLQVPTGRVSEAHHRVAEEFGTFARLVAERYRHHVDGYEIWNEPNLPRFWPQPDVAAYALLLRSSYREIHAVDREATVISAGLAPAPDANGSIAPLAFLQRLYASEARDSFDAVGMHPYSYPEMPSGLSDWNTFRGLEDVKRLMASHGDGDKKIWLTEYGAPTGGLRGVSPEVQSAMVVEAFELAKQDPAIGPIFMYTLVDGGAPRYDTEYHFGLYYQDQTPKPAVRALQEAALDCPAPAEGDPPGSGWPGDLSGSLGS